MFDPHTPSHRNEEPIVVGILEEIRQGNAEAALLKMKQCREKPLSAESYTRLLLELMKDLTQYSV